MKEIQIKTLLIEYIMKNDESAFLGSEVPFQFGSRRADVMSLVGQQATVYEIKGAEDSLERLGYQIASYKAYFDYCYIVCEEVNLGKVRRNIGKEIGILLVSNGEIKKIRKSQQFIRHNKITLASTIPTNILRKELGNNSQLRSKQELCEYAAKTLLLDEIRKSSRSTLIERYKPLTLALKKEIGQRVTPDDILTITRMPPSVLIRRTKSNPTRNVINHPH